MQTTLERLSGTNAFARTAAFLKTHLKLVKAEEAGFAAYLHGDRRYGIIGEQFPEPSFWQALFPPVDSFKRDTNVRHILRHTCTGKARTIRQC